MGNVCWSPCVLLFFFFISTSLCVASDQITSNSPSLHGDATVKHMFTTISNVKTQSVGSRTAYGGRKMKTDDERVKQVNNHHVNLEEGDEASKQQTIMAAKGIRARKQQLKTTDMDSFVSYADYPGPRHHPPKNN